MKAMILAAGKGTRVWPVTKTTPKPMIPVLRTPIMESLVNHFKHFGIEDIAVNISYMGSEIENYFRDGKQFGVNITYSFEGELVDGELEANALGSAGGLQKIQQFGKFFDDTFIVVCGDAWVDLDLDEAYRFHREKGGVATIVLKDVDMSEVHKYGVVQRDENGQILAFQEKPTAEEAVSNTINTGIYIFEPEIFEHIPIGQEFDIGGELFPSLVEKDIPFYGISMDFQWLDIGSLTDIWQATSDIMTGKVKGYPMPGKQVKPNVWQGINVDIDLDEVTIEGPVFIGSGTRIENGVTIIGPATIGANCVIESGAIIEHCLVDDYTWVSAVVHLKDKVLFGEHCIEHSGDFTHLPDWNIGWAINDSRCRLNNSRLTNDDLYQASLMVAQQEYPE